MIRTNFLKSERLHLTPLRKADIETIQSWETDLHYMRNLDTGPALPGTREAIERRFQDMLDGKTSDEVMLMMRRPGEDHAIGFVGLDGIQWRHGVASLAIGIGAVQDRSQGYGAEAMRLLLDFAFNELNLYRIGLTVFGYNTAAIRLYERLGFVHEGTARQFMERDGRRWDMHYYGLLRDEWHNR